MEAEILEPSCWSFYEGISSTFHQVEPFDFSVDTPLFTVIFSDDHGYCPIDHEGYLQLPSLIDDGFSMDDLGAFDPTLSSQILGIIHACPQEGEQSFPSLQNLCSEEDHAWSPTPSLIIPEEDMEMENQLSLPHLLGAIGEALEQRHNILAGVILRCVSHKVSPLGDTLDRLAFNLSRNHDPTEQGTFIKQESCNNFREAFVAIYRGLPHGRIAHFAANSAIVGSIPEDSEFIHIIDFDMGEGVQWPPLMEAIAQHHKTLKLTAIRWEEEEIPDLDCVSTQWKFEEIRRNLYEHAKSCGLKLKLEEQSIEELVTELKKLNKRGGHGNGKRNFVAFNCMAGLPHMGRVRSRSHVREFLRVAKDFIKSSPSNRGIVAFGDGEACEKLRSSTNFRTFFNGHLVHYHALLQSMESNFPFQFSEARTAMENLFVAPYISSEGWLRRWEEGWNVESEIGLEGLSLREETLMEVAEMLRVMDQGSYEVNIEGNNGSEMVLEWKGTQLIKISTWGTLTN